MNYFPRQQVTGRCSRRGRRASGRVFRSRGGVCSATVGSVSGSHRASDPHQGPGLPGRTTGWSRVVPEPRGTSRKTRSSTGVRVGNRGEEGIGVGTGDGTDRSRCHGGECRGGPRDDGPSGESKSKGVTLGNLEAWSQGPLCGRRGRKGFGDNRRSWKRPEIGTARFVTM